MTYEQVRTETKISLKNNKNSHDLEKYFYSLIFIIKVPKFKIQAPFVCIAQYNLYLHGLTVVSNKNQA